MTKLETFLDYFLIEEIPVKDSLKTGVDGILRTEKSARKPMYGKVLAADTEFPRNGVMVPNPIRVGDVVKTNEFGRDYQTFSVEDEKPGATKYYLIRFDDIQGRVSSGKPEQQCYRRIKSHADNTLWQCSHQEGHKGQCTFTVRVPDEA